MGLEFIKAANTNVPMAFVFIATAKILMDMMGLTAKEQELYLKSLHGKMAHFLTVH